MDNDIPCRCGHTHWESRAHRALTTNTKECFAEVVKDDIRCYCSCNNYIQDNLKYLEQKYEETLK